MILNTYSHYDHVGGNQALKRTTGCQVISGNNRTSGNDRLVTDSETTLFEDIAIKVVATPGHTDDSLCFFIPGQPDLVFTGDTLFVGGCGRLFEGTAKQMWASFQQLASLPDNTLVYCGHEYSTDNFAFALHIDPTNKLIQQRKTEINALIRSGKPTVPSTIVKGKKTNVFMLAGDKYRFAESRRQKMHFKQTLSFYKLYFNP